MIEVRNLAKRYGGKAAVDDLSFVVEPAGVTGFLGPNYQGLTATPDGCHPLWNGSRTGQLEIFTATIRSH